MFAPGTVMDPVKDTILPGTADVDNRLAFSRRPAILAYRSWVMEYLSRLTQLHMYLLGWRQEAEKLTVSLWEGLEFARGWRNVPATMRLEIQSTNRMQVYSARAIFRARFRGLRWLMYNHRVFSAFVFITGFWSTELLFAGLAWAAFSYARPSSPQEGQSPAKQEDPDRIKNEDEEESKLSETERTFPTSSKQPLLRYESPGIKQEEEDGDGDAVMLPDPSATRATEADDEDDDTFVDSGLGTSLESGMDRIRRRRSRRSEDGFK